MSWRHARGTVCPTCKAAVGIVLVAQVTGDPSLCPRCYSPIPPAEVKAEGEPVVAIEAGRYRGQYGVYTVDTAIVEGKLAMRVDYGADERPDARYRTMSPEDFADMVAELGWRRVSA